MVDIIISILQYLGNENGGLFMIYLIMNILDWLTGTAKAKYYKKENSTSGAIGIIKKLGNWIIIFISFALSYSFVRLGKMTHIDLGITSFFGWFVLLTMTVNEIRSILENLIECNIKIPKVLIKGLEIWNRKIENIEDSTKKDEM